jgi:hypothetical protein
VASNALLTTLHPLLKNVPQTVDHFEISYLGDLDCLADVLMGFHQSTFSKPNTEINSDLAPMRFLGFLNHEKGAPRQEILK